MQPLLALGGRVALKPWGLRIVLAMLVVAGGALQLGAAPPSGDTLVNVRSLLVQSGFRVEDTRRTWLDGKIRDGQALVASHPACREPIVVKPVELDTPPATDPDAPQFYVYDSWESGFPPRLTVLRIALGLEIRSILSFGRIPKPPRAMLAINDPSACLPLAGPDWRRLWNGTVGIARG